MQAINSKNPFAYLGVEPYVTPDFKQDTRDPTSLDRKNFYLGQLWLNSVNKKVFMLTGISGNIATWSYLVNGGILINSYVTDSGTVAPSSYALNMVGDSFFVSTTGSGNNVSLSMIARGDDGQLLIGSTAGSASWANLSSSGNTVSIQNSGNAINIEDAGPFVAAISGDSGTAYQSGNNILIEGGSYMTTAAAAATVTINLDSNITVSDTLSLTALNTEGVLQTDAGGVASSDNGTSGQLLIGGGTAPNWANLASSDASISINDGANSINLSVPSYLPVDYSFTGFSVRTSGSNQNSVTGAGTEYVVQFNSELFDVTDVFTDGTTFTASESGKYYLHFTAQINLVSLAQEWRPSIKVGNFYYFGLTTPGLRRCSGYGSSTTTIIENFVTSHVFCLVSMTAGQTATALVQASGSGSDVADVWVDWSADDSVIPLFFKGYLVNNI